MSNDAFIKKKKKAKPKNQTNKPELKHEPETKSNRLKNPNQTPKQREEKHHQGNFTFIK